jgi:hypothetical protein
MGIDPKIKKRIQKLLALGSNNENPNEADNALRKAAKLAEQYGLAISDMDPITGEVKNVNTERIKVHNKSQNWVIILGSIIAETFECELITSTNSYKEKNLVFLGTPSDIELAIWYFKLIKIKTMRQAEQFNKAADQKTYATGVVIALKNRLHEMFVMPRLSERSKDVKALVVQKDTAIKEEMHKQFPKLRNSRQKVDKLTSHSAYSKGQQDGKTMALHRGELKQSA